MIIKLANAGVGVVGGRGKTTSSIASSSSSSSSSRLNVAARLGIRAPASSSSTSVVSTSPTRSRRSSKPRAVAAAAAATDLAGLDLNIADYPLVDDDGAVLHPPLLVTSSTASTPKKRRLQVQTVPDLALNTSAIRCLDWDRDRFDIEFGLSDGTTYNSYLVFGDDKTALVETSHEKFRDEYLARVAELLALKGRDTIDYVLLDHMEPDHTGLTADVLDAYPGATVVATKVGLAYLSNLMHRPFAQLAVKAGDSLDLGGGHKLTFVPAPNLHWPDTMFSFDEASGVMFTCDAFGAHYCTQNAFDSDLSALAPHYRFYFDCLMLPNARSVTTAIRKVSEVPYSLIGTGHGPILRHNVPELVGRYQKWSEAAGKAGTTVAVLYPADYGFADRLAQSLARGITKVGDVATEMVDVCCADQQELAAAVGKASGVVVLAPPTAEDGETEDVDAASSAAKASLATLFSAIDRSARVVVAESYGGRDEPVDTLVAQLVDAGMQLPPPPPLRVKAEPTEQTYQAYEEAGTDLAQSLTQRASIARVKAAMSPEVAKALARVSGGLYIVTAAHSNAGGEGGEGGENVNAASARGAMVASWVAQASFEPRLGLTVAVAKDRAIESLMQVGDRFVLNCLSEGKEQRLMRHFLQRFPPGADRFAGVEWQPSPSGSGVPVLSGGDVAAFVECEVVSRLETPDHFVTYAQAVEGGVADPDARTAVHRRKVANYY